jgi:hypothetical protein
MAEKDLERLRELVALFELRLISTDEVIDEATDFLGVIDPGPDSLVRIAVQRDTRWEDVHELCLRVLTELGLALPSRVEAGRLGARKIARDIVAGAEPPLQGARKLWSDIARQVPELLEELAEFAALADDWEERFKERDSVDQEIVARAEAFLGRKPQNPGEDKRRER